MESIILDIWSLFRTIGLAKDEKHLYEPIRLEVVKEHT